MLTGTVTTIFGDDINTDDIITAFRLQQSNDPEYFGTYAFEKFDPEFRSRCGQRDANIVVAGKNFGCGSSREQACSTLKGHEVAVVAKSISRIFLQNSINLSVDDLQHFMQLVRDGEQALIDAGKNFHEVFAFHRKTLPGTPGR